MRNFRLVSLLALPLFSLSCNTPTREKPTPVCSTNCKKCDPQKGCMDCVASKHFCDADAVLDCNADGTVGAPVKMCDTANGEQCKDGNCLTPCDTAASTHSYIGCDYWPVTLLNAELDPLFDFAVAVANPLTVGDGSANTTPAVVKVVQGGAPCVLPPMEKLEDNAIAYATVSPGQVKTLLLPWMTDLSQNLSREISTDVTDGAYHLCSSLPVTVYQFNPLQFQKQGAKCKNDPNWMPGQPCHSYTNDASLLLPSTALQKDYIVAAYGTFGLQQAPNFLNPRPSPGATPGYMAVVGTQNDTTVNITFSSYVEGGIGVDDHVPGDKATFKIQAGEVLEIISARPAWSTKDLKLCKRTVNDFQGTYCDFGKDYDLTGTQISADKPVAAFGGHSCAFVPYNKWACDHLEQQLFPLDTWGQTSLAVQTPPSVMGEPNVFRVIAGTPMTTLTFDPPSVMKPVTLNTGEWVELTTEGGFQVTGLTPMGNARLLVSQYMVGEDYVANQFMGVGDPSMGLVVPIEQYRKSYDFLSPDTYTRSYVTVIAKTGSTFTLDSKDQMVGFNQMIGNTGYGFEFIELVPGGHHITSDMPFGINVSGVAAFTSYLFPGGLNLIEIGPQ